MGVEMTGLQLEARRTAMATGARIRKMRLKRRMTQEELSDAAGLRRGAVSNYETGAVTPSLEALLVLAYALEVEPGMLLARVEGA